MKKAVTLDAIMVSFICAMGYGFGFTVPSAYGVNGLVSFIICMALGLILTSILLTAFDERDYSEREAEEFFNKLYDEESK